MLSDNMDTYKSQVAWTSRYMNRRELYQISMVTYDISLIKHVYSKHVMSSTWRSVSLKPLPHEMLETEIVASLLPVFDIVLVVELLMLLMTSMVICVIANDVTVNLHRTEQYDRNVEERKKMEENACFTTSWVSIGFCKDMYAIPS
nr:hypothetical protein [Tanacetum cinerariifolium]